ncbi:MAG: hypothetical protein HKN26_00460 [Acidimicrobiales bacterium]|nr:hypothetical protein [Acidimicrobiales bacterium]
MDPDGPTEPEADLAELRAEIDRLRDLCARAEAAVGVAEAEAHALRDQLAAVTAERDAAIHARNVVAADAGAASSPAGLAGRLRSKLGR